MTFKTNIAFSAIISLALVVLIACQQNPQATKDEKGLNDKIKTQIIKVEDTAKKDWEAASKAEADAKEAAKKLEEKAKDAEAKAKEEIKEMKTKVEEAAEKVKSDIEAIESKTGVTTELKEDSLKKNLLVNGDFNDDLTNWQATKGVIIIQEDGKKCVEITGYTNGQNRIWQEFSAISGHVYKLSFNVKAEKGMAFIIWRDHQANKESYFFTNPSKEWQNYTKEFKSKRNGRYMIFLSTKGEGTYYYSETSLIDLSSTE